MPFSNLPSGGGNDFNWFAVAVMLALSLWGGFVNYLGRIKAGLVKRFDLVELAGELAISSFAGLVVGLILIAFEVDLAMTVALAGVAGHAGARTVYLLNKIFEERLVSLTNRIKK